MLRYIKYLLLLPGLMSLTSCSGNNPSEIIVQNETYNYVNEEPSSGGKFDILNYSNGKGDVHLVVPREPADLDKFSSIYTNTFKAQGFTMLSSGNKHIGISGSKIVYLTVSPRLDALSILLINKTPNAKTTFGESADIFRSLKSLS